jgi:hypothetical protein
MRARAIALPRVRICHPQDTRTDLVTQAPTRYC